jgi:hypothetical protein
VAITSINKDFSSKRKDVNLLAKDFSSYRQRLIDFAKTYFPNTYNDYTDTSIGNMFIELVSYASDVLSYQIDYNFKESLLTHASEPKNVIALSQSLGYKIPLSSGAVTSVDVFQLLPDNGSGQPDFTYALKIRTGMKITSQQNPSVTFRTLEPIDFSDMENLSTRSKYISVFQESGGSPTFWLVRYYRQVPVVAGNEKTFTYTVGSPEQFLTIELPENDVIDVVSIQDSDGNVYYEVDYLAQDTVFTTVEISNSTEEPYFEPVLQKVPRRFITRVNKKLKLEIQFGSGTTDSDDERIISALSQIQNLEESSELSIDPSSFATSKTYGKTPSNTTLTIKYTVGGGVETNVPQNDLVNVTEVVYENDLSSLSDVQVSTLNQIKTTLSTTNQERATGGNGLPTVDEIRQNALQFFSTQKRCVTANDYKARVLSIPSKFGRVAKAYAKKVELRENQTRPESTINLFLLGYNDSNNLTKLNIQTKKNISTYLNEFRMLTDGVNLLDGYIINIGVNFSISVFRGYNKNDVLLNAIETVKTFFDITKMDFNQPIYLSDLELQIANVDGVRTVNSVEIVNKTSSDETYSNVSYPTDSATKNKILYPSLEPSVFEIKYPNQDIKGKVE